MQGAIGTRHKIDASYLSPHVNMSARLEAATKQYGVTLLLTNAMYNELSYDVRATCRPLDRVTVKGSTEPVTLYTCDTSPTGIQSCLALPSTSYEDHQLLMSKIVHRSSELSEKFMYNWNAGYNEYVSGQWNNALDHFQLCRNIRCWDTPLHVLTTYIRSAGVQKDGQGGELKEDEDVDISAPEGWRGYRSLHSK